MKHQLHVTQAVHVRVYTHLPLSTWIKVGHIVPTIVVPAVDQDSVQCVPGRSILLIFQELLKIKVHWKLIPIRTGTNNT